VKTILDQLESGRSPADQVPALKQLSELSVDSAFAQEFINQDGLKLISSKIENESWSAITIYDIFISADFSKC